MPVNLSGQGARFAPRTVTVSPRQALAYAAAIGCEAPRFLDDAAEQGLEVVAPYCTSLEWLISGDPSSREPLGASAAERARVVHASQDSRFHRPLMAGETVTVGGFIAQVQSTRAGALVTSVMTVTGKDPQDQISTSRITSLYRGVATDAPALAPQETAPDAATFDQAGWTTVEIPVSRGFAHVYTECAQIWNPIHTERRAALAAGLPDIIVHGSALWALAWRELETSHGRLGRLSGRFSAMATPGLPLRMRMGAPDAEGAVAFQLLNAEGREAISRGVAHLR